MSSELLYTLSELPAFWMFGIIEQFIFVCLYEILMSDCLYGDDLPYIKTKIIKELILNESFQLFI